MTPTPEAVATAERILADTPHAGIDYPELRHRIAFALTAQAQAHPECHPAALCDGPEQARETRRATWAAALDLMAAMEADIAAEPRHSVGEVRGAHMLGATIRARAAAQGGMG